MKKMLAVSLTALTCTLPLLAVIPAQAAQYSAARANSVRLVWRRSMHAHSYHTSLGARYSKHLGVRYAFNHENITWITNAHEKLYDKKKHTAAIYYHVNSADGRHGGWIWRGYLRAGAASASRPATTPVMVTSNSAEADDDAIDRLARQLETTILSLFPGTVSDSHLWDEAAPIIEPSNGVDALSITAPKGQTLIRLRYHPLTQQSYKQTYDQLLTQAGYPAAKRAQYRGWQTQNMARVSIRVMRLFFLNQPTS